MWHPLATCRHLPHPFGHWPCQSQSHAPPLSLHARALTPFECHADQGGGAWPRKARMALRSTAVGLLGLSSFDCRVSGAPSTKDALHFNEDIRRCDSVSVATPASSLVSTDCRLCPSPLGLPLSPVTFRYPMPSLPPAAVSHCVTQSVSFGPSPACACLSFRTWT